jgi:hypothetical protein
MNHGGIPGRRAGRFVGRVLAFAVPLHLFALVVGFVLYVGGVLPSDKSPAEVAAEWDAPSAASPNEAFAAIRAVVDALPDAGALALAALMLVALLPAVTLSLLVVFDLLGKRPVTAVLAAVQVAVMIVAISGVIGG